MPKYTLYEILVDVGQRPERYNIATMGELKSFVDGYRLATALLEAPPTEVPPLRQFTEWLVRELGHGNTSCGWWQLIQWENADDQHAIAEFGRLVALFAQRIPQQVAHVEIDDATHTSTGEFRVSYRREGDLDMVDLSDRLPVHLRLLKYTTDLGVYLEYHFNVDEPYLYEQYFDTASQAYNEAQRNFGVTASDWKTESGAAD